MRQLLHDGRISLLIMKRNAKMGIVTALETDIDPDGLLEYSVVFNDRSLNHM